MISRTDIEDMSDAQDEAPRGAMSPYSRVVYAFDSDETANEFLSEDGEGGFAAGVYRMAKEIRRLRAAGPQDMAGDERVEALVSFARPFADALEIECDFMTPPAPFEDGFDARARARSALAALDTPKGGGEC